MTKTEICHRFEDRNRTRTKHQRLLENVGGASSTVTDEKKETIGGDPKICAPIVGKASLEEKKKSEDDQGL